MKIFPLTIQNLLKYVKQTRESAPNYLFENKLFCPLLVDCCFGDPTMLLTATNLKRN